MALVTVSPGAHAHRRPGFGMALFFATLFSVALSGAILAAAIYVR